jgi:hypothetical protein
MFKSKYFVIKSRIILTAMKIQVCFDGGYTISKRALHDVNLHGHHIRTAEERGRDAKLG